jgi:hypothetical protein
VDAPANLNGKEEGSPELEASKVLEITGCDADELVVWESGSSGG